MLILLLLPPLPYRGTSLSSSTRALHTGQSWQVEWLWSHRYRHGQQKRWPHIVTTGSSHASKHMLQSKLLLLLLLFPSVIEPSSFSWSTINSPHLVELQDWHSIFVVIMICRLEVELINFGNKSSSSSSPLTHHHHNHHQYFEHYSVLPFAEKLTSKRGRGKQRKDQRRKKKQQEWEGGTRRRIFFFSFCLSLD